MLSTGKGRHGLWGRVCEREGRFHLEVREGLKEEKELATLSVEGRVFQEEGVSGAKKA